MSERGLVISISGVTLKSAGEWVAACPTDVIEPEEALRFDHAGRTYVIVRSPEGDFFAMDGHCSHEKVHLADGVVDGYVIECPRHFGAFEYRTGRACALPACIDLRRYEIKVEANTVFILV